MVLLNLTPSPTPPPLRRERGYWTPNPFAPSKRGASTGEGLSQPDDVRQWRPMTDEARDAYLRSLIRDIPDFPQPGIVFKDITTLIRDRDGFRHVVDGIAAAHRGIDIDLVVGVESRGFIFAAPIAIALGAGLVPVRKPGKLPAKVISQAYELEYGRNVLELHADAIELGQRVLVIDDVLATGGSLGATIDLVHALGGVVAGVSVVIELSFLGGRARLARSDLHALLTY